eukprot:g43849.t1
MLLTFWLHFIPKLLFYGRPVWEGVDKSMRLLMALHLGLVKTAINGSSQALLFRLEACDQQCALPFLVIYINDLDVNIGDMI